VGKAPAKERDLAAAVTSLEKTVSQLQGQVQQLNLLLNSTKPQASLPSVSEPANVSGAPVFCGRCQASRTDTNSPDSSLPSNHKPKWTSHRGFFDPQAEMFCPHSSYGEEKVSLKLIRYQIVLRVEVGPGHVSNLFSSRLNIYSEILAEEGV
jgi:hypothetical protein